MWNLKFHVCFSFGSFQINLHYPIPPLVPKSNCNTPIITRLCMIIKPIIVNVWYHFILSYAHNTLQTQEHNEIFTPIQGPNNDFYNKNLILKNSTLTFTLPILEHVSNVHFECQTPYYTLLVESFLVPLEQSANTQGYL
jgi:hypothetical protein